jgi:Bacteriophytochrome (light-regulated signal transduction histidine kinase)
MNAPINILIVDDEPKNLTVLELVLNDPGYRLVRASSADEALLALVMEEFALLILDVRMPGMNGFELAQMVKERKKTAHVPIIFLTAFYNEDQHVLEGYGSGAVDYLHKPINPVILRSKVAVFARMHRVNRANAEANRALVAEVSERRKAEEQLRETVQELEAFSYSIAHDMRAPLRSMQGFAEILDSEHAGQLDEAGRDYLRRIAAAASRMDALILDILNYSKVGHGELALREVDVERLVRDIAATYPTLRAEQADIVIEGPLPSVMANEAALTQIVSNLLGNAVKFVAPGVRPRVTVRGEVLNGVARLWFEDNGIGIPERLHPRLFRIFSRLQRREDYEGTGIGLAIVRKAAERMSGSVGLESSEGAGSRFWVQLKRAG